PTKGNLTKEQKKTGLAFHVVERPPPPPLKRPLPTIEWEAAPVSITADEALESRPDGRRSQAKEAAQNLLIELLADGPKPTTDIEAAAAAHGIGEKSLKNAKIALYIRAARVGGRWWWCLPGQEPPM